MTHAIGSLSGPDQSSPRARGSAGWVRILIACAAPALLFGFPFATVAAAADLVIHIEQPAEPIELTLSAPGDGQVIELPPIDGVTGLGEPFAGVHPFAAARVSVAAIERQITEIKLQLGTLAGALQGAGYFFDELDPENFRLFGAPYVEYDPVIEVARDVLNQDLGLATKLFGANLIDPWGRNAVHPMRLRAALRMPDLQAALESVRSRFDGHPLSDEYALQQLAILSLRAVRKDRGLEKVRVQRSPADQLPIPPNSRSLLIGGKINLTVAYKDGLEACDTLAGYWLDVEEQGLWTETDATFAEEIAPFDWVDQAPLPYVTRTGDTVPRIAEQIVRECEDARSGRQRVKAMQSMVEIAAASIDVEKGLEYVEVLYPKALADDFNFSEGVRRNAEAFAIELAPSRLKELARQLGAPDDVLDEAEAKEVADLVLVALEDLKWSNYRFRGNQRRLSEAEIDGFRNALVAMTQRRLPNWRFSGTLLSVDETSPPVSPVDLAPNGFQVTSATISDYDRAFVAIDSRLGFALARLATSDRPLDLLVASLADAAMLVVEARVEKTRLANNLLLEWTALASSLDRLRRQYDFGRIWAEEPIRVTSLIATANSPVLLGDALITAEPLGRFKLSVAGDGEAPRLLRLLPAGVRLSGSMQLGGLPPFSERAKRQILAAGDPVAERARLSELYRTAPTNIAVTATVTEETDDAIVLEVSFEPPFAPVAKVSLAAAAWLETLGFDCSPGGDSPRACRFPLGLVGSETLVSVTLQPDAAATQRLETEQAWRRLTAQ